MPTDEPVLRLPARLPGRVAILAGGGLLPLMIAESVSRRGGRVHIVAIEGEADAAVSAYPHTWVNYGQASRMMAALKGDAPTGPDNTMVIAGAVTRPNLAHVRPDLGLLRLLPQVLKFITAGGDDALLTRIIRMYEAQGLHISGVHDVASELLIAEGPLGAVAMDEAGQRDAARGVEVLMALGDLDVGQGVVVTDGRVVAIEGVEGTDRMLARAAPFGGAGAMPSSRGVLVKRPKPGQERRVDLPTIGPRTVAGAKSAHLAGIAVAAHETLVLDRTATIEAADASGFYIVGETVQLVAAAPATSDTHIDCRQLGRRTPSQADLADVGRGATAVDRLFRFATGHAAAVVRLHVVAVAAAEGPVGILQRLEATHQWGLRRLTGRRGALAVRHDRYAPLSLADQTAIADGLRRSRLAGLALVARGPAEPLEHHVQADLDAAGLFIVEARVG